MGEIFQLQVGLQTYNWGKVSCPAGLTSPLISGLY